MEQSDFELEFDEVLSDVSENSDIGDFIYSDCSDSESAEEMDECDDEPQAYRVEVVAPNSPTAKFVSKNGTVWLESMEGPVPPSQKKRPTYGKPRRASYVSSPVDALKLFITDDMVQEIITETNREAAFKLQAKNSKKLAANPNAKLETWIPFSEIEFWAYLGIIITAGADKSWDVPTRELFYNSRSDPIYRAAMSGSRFEQIRGNLRFDDRATRKQRPEMGRLAPIKNVFDMLMANLLLHYVPNHGLTLDEQLLAYKGRSAMIQYMPAKPAKFGIKIFWICDAVNGYALIGRIYAGKEGGKVTRGLAQSISKELTVPFYGTKRTLTMDNYFTSLALVEYLATKQLCVVGTIRANKPELPVEFKGRNERELYSTLFGFRHNMMLASYVAKKNKVVNLISSLHRSRAVDGAKRKPEVVLYYNKNKFGVDLMDQKVCNYTCKRITRRWPMAIWSNIVDIAALNAEILYHLMNPNVNLGRSDKRRLFLKELGTALVKPAMEARLNNNPRLPKATIEAMGIFGVKKEPEVMSGIQLALLEPQLRFKSGTRTRCYKCVNDNKTSLMCQCCHMPVCRVHSRVLCEYCIKQKKSDKDF